MKRMSWVLGLALAALCLAFAGFPQPAACAASTTPPTGTIVINNNRSATNTPNVTLALTWSDGAGSGVSRMRFSNDGATWSAWEVLAATRAWTLPGTDGHKTVRAQYLDKANNRSTVYSDYIRLDTTPPTGSIVINNGAPTTASQAVTLGLTWDDGAGSQVSRMRFSDDGAHWTAWEPQTAARAYTLPAGLGYHTVRVQYLDGAGNYSAACNDYIKVQIPAPGATETVLLPGSVPLVMVWIPGGTFTMGSPNTDPDLYYWEEPRHSVTLGGFWMGKYEFTQAQWKAVTDGANPSSFQGETYGNTDNRPVENVSWNAIQTFVAALNRHITITGQGAATMRLPSEAEWEYACRAGTLTRFYWGDDLGYADIGNYAWISDNSGGQTHDVGTAGATGHPNAFGLYDMGGNVWEWCADDMHDYYTGAPTGGQAWVDAPRGPERVKRSGGIGNYGVNARSAARYGSVPSYAYADLGFRLSR